LPSCPMSGRSNLTTFAIFTQSDKSSEKTISE
jgi:hypothetical protein